VLAVPEGYVDPILGMIAERARIRALAKASSARLHQISTAWNNDLDGCGWPPADYSGPEIADMREWLERRHSHTSDIRVGRPDVEMFNAELLAWDTTHEPNLLEQDRQDNAARLAWVDRRVAERGRNAEIARRLGPFFFLLSWPMPYRRTVTPNRTARSLIAVHGAGALETAKRAAENLQRLGKTQRLDEWIQVIAEIRRIQKS
jgi:hypothetical protein